MGESGTGHTLNPIFLGGEAALNTPFVVEYPPSLTFPPAWVLSVSVELKGCSLFPLSAPPLLQPHLILVEVPFENKVLPLT